MRIAIIGSGITGLTCAYELSKTNSAEIFLFEKNPFLGGFASIFDFGGGQIERYYHFICGCDHELINVIEELGIKNRLKWKQNKSGIFYNGKIYPFSTPFDLLRFKPLSLFSRIRSGLALKYAMQTKHWNKFEGILAVEWLKKLVGQHAYNIIWHPLLKIKFGHYYDQISAPWIWHRIHRVASSRKSIFSKEMIGYIEGGTKTLLDTLEKIILGRGVKVFYNNKVEKVIVKNKRITEVISNGTSYSFDVVISTIPLPSVYSLLPDESNELKEKIKKISFIGVVCLILKLRYAITENFWLNINDSHFSYNGIIEYSNLNPVPQFNGASIAYIPYYLPEENPFFKYSSQKIFEKTISPLHMINPDFDLNWVIDYRVFRDKYAQPICTVNFSQQVIPHETSIKNFYIADSSQLYPMDRNLSGMIGLAKRISHKILKS